MYKRFIHLAFGLAVLGGLSACTNQLLEEPQVRNTHRVYFSAGSAQTKTGITVEDGLMTPDWRKTDPVNVHLFEIGTEGYSVGEDVTISLSEENTVAHFKADFPTGMTIIVDPNAKATTQKSAETVNTGPFTYAAVVAQAQGSAYIVPAVQHPDAETLIDPSADFLIGFSRKTYDDPHNYEETVVDLWFDRPVALGRINVSGFAGTDEVIKSVVVKAPGLSGSAAYSAIDFEHATVVFTPDTVAEDEVAALTLDYGSGLAPATDGTFSAYFVALPGTARISEIVVTTDQWAYTKTVDKEVSFSNETFKNLKLDLSSAAKQEVIPEEIKWYKASVLENGIDYLIVSQGNMLNNGTDGLTGVDAPADNDGVLEFEQEPGASVIWTATANEIAADDNLVAGHFTLSNGENVFLQRVSVGNHEYEMGVGSVPGTAKYYAWDYDGTYLYHISNSSATFYCFYNDGWVTGYQNQKEVQIYTSRPPQELSFGETSVTFNKDSEEAFVAPTLSGAQPGATVTYSSSNEAVATVEADGSVNILSAGTTVITAIAAGNADYQAGSASYTLVVTSGQTDTFYLAEEIVAGDSYMIVSGGKAMTTDGSTLGTVDVTGAGEATIQIAASEVALFEAAEHIEYYSGTSPAGHYTLSHGGKYLQRHSDSSTQTGAIGDIPSTKKYYVWEYDGVHLYHISNADNTFYLGYDSGWVFKYGETLPTTYLYSTTKQKAAQHLSFSTESVSAVLGQAFTAPTLEGVKTSVSFTSSNEDVATVDATSGEVSLVGIGETTITASAPADEEYNTGTASYTLKVTDGNVPTWYLAEEIEDGETYLIVSNGYLLQNNGGNVAAVAVEVTGDVIKYDAPATEIWTATASSGKFTFKNDGKYLYRSSSTLSINTSSVSWSYDSSAHYLSTAGNSSSYYLFYDTAQNSFRVSSSSPSSSRTTALYGSNPSRQTQELVLSSTSVTFDTASGETFIAPTLSGAQTDVSWSSSKPAVATVDAETGAVEIVGVGTTVITASAEGSDTYKPASISYTLKVNDSSTPVTKKRYVLATEIVDGKGYLIVSGGNALKNDGGSVASVGVTPVENVIEFESDEDEGLVWTATRETSLPTNGDYVFSNDGKYIRRPSGGGTTLSIEAKPSSWSKYFVFLYDGSHFYHHNLGGQNGDTEYVYWLHYDEGWLFAYTATTDPNHADAKTTLLYVEAE